MKFLIPKMDRVIIKPDEKEEKSKGGIHIPDSSKDRPKRGRVLAVGPGRYLENGQRVPVEIEVGNMVWHTEFGGYNLEVDGEKYLVLNEADILAVEGKSRD